MKNIVFLLSLVINNTEMFGSIIKFALRLFIILCFFGAKAQFSAITNPIILQIGYNSIVDSNNIFTFNGSTILKYTISPFDTISIFPPKANNLCNISYIYCYSKDVFVVNEIDNTNFNFIYATIDCGKNWIQLKLPSGKKPSYYTCDLIKRQFYFSDANSGNNKLYKIVATTSAIDSFNFNFIERSIKSLNNSIGYMLIYDSISPYNFRGVAKTSDGAISYSILGNINYSIAPYSANGGNNDKMKNIYFVTDSFWVAEYEYDSATYKMKKIMASKDGGKNWSTILYSGITIISKASNSSAYLYQEKAGGKGLLYQISQSGSITCLTAFSKRITTMNFWNADKGHFITIDTPNLQPGIWRISNGGGAPCSIAGINNKNIQSNLITLYPNPANNQITLANYSLPVHSNYQIYNLLGTLVQQGNLEEKETTININTLADGLYFIRVGVTSLKFVKGKD